MNIEYGSCYKNVKEAAYNSVSTAMRRYASNMEDDCSYALHRMNRCVDCDTETFDYMYRRLHEYKMYRLLQSLIEKDELSYTQMYLLIDNKKNIDSAIELFYKKFEISVIKNMIDKEIFYDLKHIFINLFSEEMCDMIKEVGYRINVIPETELLIVTNSKLSEEELEKLTVKVHTHKFAEHPGSLIRYLGYSCYSDFEDRVGLFVRALKTRHNRKIIEEKY